MLAFDGPWLCSVVLSPIETMTDDRTPTTNESVQSDLSRFGLRAVDQATLKATNE